MVPVDQTVFDNLRGNCYAACIASVLEMKLEDVPWPNGNNDDFAGIYETWFAELNLQVVYAVPGVPMPKGYLIASVPSPRFPGSNHAVVIKDGRVVHDPHPSRASLRDDLSEVTCVDLLTILDPTRPVRVGRNPIDSAIALSAIELQVRLDDLRAFARDAAYALDTVSRGSTVAPTPTDECGLVLVRHRDVLRRAGLWRA